MPQHHVSAARRFSTARFYCLVFLFVGTIPAAYTQTTLLVDFGASAPSNTFGLAGWNTVLTSGNLTYTAAGPGGVVVTTDVDELTDSRGVRGSARTFSRGERVVVTWFNNSDEDIIFTARISFTDSDVPEGGTSTGSWFTMRQYDDYRNTYTRVAPRSSCRTTFNIETAGVHKTDGAASLVNINLAIEWGDNSRKPALVCDKIELMNDADTQAPLMPTGLQGSALNSSTVVLRWNASNDNTGTVGYLIRLNGEIERYSSTTNDTIHHLSPSTRYTCTVAALDHTGNESAQSTATDVTTSAFPSSRPDLLQPNAFTYLGAIRLPDPVNYGGEAVAYNPDGDGGQTGAGSGDGFPGSLFTVNNSGPDDGFVGEIGLPAPKIAATVDALNEATLLQDFVNIRPPSVIAWPFVDVWNVGLAWLPSAGGGALYSAWSYYYQVTAEKTASISVTRATPLAGAARHGAWYVNTSTTPLDAALNDYLFALPENWANAHTGGRRLVTGRNREGGLSGLGPTLHAFRAPDPASPPAPNAELSAVALVQYGPVEQSAPHFYPNSFANYHHADWFRGAAWVAAGSRSAVVLFGNKGRGDNWYGYTGESMHHDWVTADLPYPAFADTDPDGKGWRGHSRIPMLVFYDPTDLARVAAGVMQPHIPQPYAALRPPASIFPRRFSVLRDAAYDITNRLFYAVEMAPELDGRVLLHVWRVEGGPVSTETVETTTQPDLDIYPQPATTQLHFTVRAPAAILSSQLVDALGRVVQYAATSNGVVNTNGVPAGVYHLVVETRAGYLTKPVLIVR